MRRAHGGESPQLLSPSPISFPKRCPIKFAPYSSVFSSGASKEVILINAGIGSENQTRQPTSARQRSAAWRQQLPANVRALISAPLRMRRSSPRAQTPVELPEVRLHLARLCLVSLQQLRASRQDIFCDFVSS